MSTSSSTNSSTNSLNDIGVLRLPTHELLPGVLLKAVEDADLLVATSTGEDGEYFGMQLARNVAVADIAPDSVIMLPLFVTADAVPLDFDSMAAGPRIYLKLVGPPQRIMSYAICLAYSEGAVGRVVPVGHLVKFPTPSHFVEATAFIVGRLAAMSTTVPPVDALSDPGESSKRPCIRTPVLSGELTESNSDKGMSKFIMDLDGCKYPTRNKTDLTQREKDLGFVFRALDIKRWEFVMGTDYLLQPEEYRSMIIDQGKTRDDHRHRAFETCGFLDRVQSLGIVQKTPKLKLLLVGSFMIEGSSPTLTLDDFVDGDKICIATGVCLEQNRPMVAALRNFQLVMQVFFSNAYEGCLDSFIVKLEGSSRPLELVSADFLKYSVEFVLKKFFRIVRSERSSSMSEEISLRNPQLCRLFLVSLFDQLAADLSDNVLRVKEEVHYRVRLAREIGMSPESKSAPSRAKSAPSVNSETAKDASEKICAGHLGRLLKAVNSDGKTYACVYGKKCKFTHVGLAKKTDQNLLDLIAVMPDPACGDLKRALKKRS